MTQVQTTTEIVQEGEHMVSAKLKFHKAPPMINMRERLIENAITAMGELPTDLLCVFVSTLEQTVREERYL